MQHLWADTRYTLSNGRYVDYKSQKYHLFLLDFCYFVQVLLIVNICFFYNSQTLTNVTVPLPKCSPCNALQHATNVASLAAMALSHGIVMLWRCRV